jgi:predicted Zn-dependent protease
MKPLEPPHSHYVSAAAGWLGLGNWQEAAQELKNIDPDLASHPEVLPVRYEILAKAGQWELAAEAAAAWTKKAPRERGAWIAQAYAARRKPGGGIALAKGILSAAWQRFPTEPLIAYNLACYECQLGNLAQARYWLREAFKLGDAGQLKLMSLQDSDLEPLRSEIAQMQTSVLPEAKKPRGE